MIFTIPIHESNPNHEPAGSPKGGQFASNPPGKGKRPRPGRVQRGPGYVLTFRQQDDPENPGRGLGRYFHIGYNSAVAHALEPGDEQKLNRARVRLRFTGSMTGHLGAPIRWKAPNGVTVIYVRGQRRHEADMSAGVYHDFDVVTQEQVIPLTRNIGSGRRALRAWAKEWMIDRTTARFRARQLVRPGD